MNKLKPIILGRNKDGQILRLIFLMPIVCIVLAFLYEKPINLINGLKTLIFTKDGLFTDYFALVGVGTAYLNAGLLMLVFAILILLIKPKLNGFSLASFYMAFGFSFLGQDIVNVWPIVAGVYLYSLLKKESFKNYIFIAIFATNLAPFVSEIYLTEYLMLYEQIIYSILIGLVIGFIIPPLSIFAKKVHQGFDLYNIGFTSGLVGVLMACLLKLLGFEFETNKIIYEESNINQIIILSIISIVFILYGLLINKRVFNKFIKINKDSGQAPTDFIERYEMDISLINTGLVGILTIIFIFESSSKISGGLLYAAFFSILGFSFFGKNLRNVSYIYVGALFGHFLGLFDISSSTISLCVLLGTSIAPIGGKYGICAGILSIWIHLAIVQNTGALHGALCLYNNGFAAGIVALIMVPIIDGIKEIIKKRNKETEI